MGFTFSLCAATAQLFWYRLLFMRSYISCRATSRSMVASRTFCSGMREGLSAPREFLMTLPSTS